MGIRQMRLRRTAAGMLKASSKFCKMIAYRADPTKLAIAIERRITHPRPNPTQESAVAANM